MSEKWRSRDITIRGGLELWEDFVKLEMERDYYKKIADGSCDLVVVKQQEIVDLRDKWKHPKKNVILKRD